MSIPALARRLSLVALAALTACPGEKTPAPATPSLELTVSSVAFLAIQGEAAPPAQSLHVQARGGEVASVTFGPAPGASAPAWLGASVTGGPQDWVLQLAVADTSMAPGSHATILRLTALRGDQSVAAHADVAISLTVRGKLAVAPQSLSLAWVQGAGEAPPPQALSLSGTPGAAFTASADQPWVALSAPGGTLPATATVQVAPAGLAVGVHQASVAFGEGSQAAVVPVSLEVRAPVLQATPASLGLAATSGRNLQGSLALALDTGSAAHAWSVAGAPAWLQLSATSGTVSGAGVTLPYTVTASSLPPGTYTATLEFTAQVGSATVSRSVPVICTVDAPALVATPPSLTVAGTSGRSGGTGSIRLELDTGANPFDWTVAGVPAWLQLTPASGKVSAGGIALAWAVASTAVAPGTYTATLEFSAVVNGATVTRSVPVTCTVAAPALTVSPASLTLAGTSGRDGASGSLTVALGTGSNRYPWTVSGVPAWLRLTASSGTLDSLGVTVGYTVATAAVAPGSYAATLTFSAVVNGATITRDLPVTCTVAAPALTTSPASLALAGTSGRTAGSGTIRLTLDTGANAFGWSVSGVPPWLTLGSSSGTVSATAAAVGYTVDATAVAPGSYSATLLFSAVVNGASVTRALPLTCAVAAPAFQASPAAVSLGGASGHDLSARSVQLTLDTGANAFAWSAGPLPAWLQLAPASGTISATPLAVELTPDASALPAGTYTATVELTAQVNGAAVVTSLPVTLTLDEHKLLPSDDGVALVSLPGTAVLSRQLRLRSNRGLATTWAASSSAAWLTVTESGGTADALALTADPTDLAQDALHEAEVAVTSTDPTIPGTVAIKVGLWVGSTAPTARVSLATSFSRVAADPVRPFAYLHAGGADVKVYNVFTGAEVATIAAVGTALGSMAVSSDGSRLFVVDETSHKVIPIDLPARTAGEGWALGSTTTGLPIAYARPGGVGAVVAGRILRASDGAAFSATFPVAAGGGLGASRDGTRICGINTGYSPYSVWCSPIDHTTLTGQVLVGSTLGGSWGVGSNGRDVALSPDGSRAYVAAGAPYVFTVYDTATMTVATSLAGDAYPNAVEVGTDGRVVAAASVWYGTRDVWVYEPTGALVTGWRLSGYARAIRDRQLALSGDGRRLVVLTDDPTLQFVAVPP